MISFKRTKRRNYHNPRNKYLLSSIAGVFTLLLILTIIGFAGRSSLQAQLNETQNILAASIQSDMSKALNSHEGINRKSADLPGEILPTMRRHMYAAYEMNRYRDILWGYDSVAKLTDAERKAIPYIILANQFVCVAWFAEQDKYAELYETNKRMTAWLLERFGELKDI